MTTVPEPTMPSPDDLALQAVILAAMGKAITAATGDVKRALMGPGGMSRGGTLRVVLPDEDGQEVVVGRVSYSLGSNGTTERVAQVSSLPQLEAWAIENHPDELDVYLPPALIARLKAEALETGDCPPGIHIVEVTTGGAAAGITVTPDKAALPRILEVAREMSLGELTATAPLQVEN